MVCYDIKVEADDFIILSTDGIFESMDIFQVVRPPSLRLISSKSAMRSCSSRRIPTRSYQASSRIAKSSPRSPTIWLSS
jgi:serine phosphatase RsbU (regulator of sigma subunit)